MYTRYFGFDMAPFSIAPDPRFLYLGSSHREAMAHLLYGVRQGGLVVLTGEVGTGKTTVCRCLLQQLPDHVDVAYLINPRQTAAELLQSVLAELGLDLGGSGVTSTKVLVDLLNERLLEGHAQGRDTLLIIDEAQNLSPEVLEQLRLLTNLETTERKLLQLILLGQPELNALLASPELRQLAQRVTARHHLQALSRADVGEYIAHRLRIAGCDHPLFTAAAIRHIARRSGGIPRLINLICDRSLLGVYAESGHQVSRALCRRAATEALPPAVRRPVAGPGLAVAGGLAALAAAALLGWQAAGIEPQVERLPAAGADVATPGPSLHQGLEQLARHWKLADPPSCPGPVTADLWCVELEADRIEPWLQAGLPLVVESAGEGGIHFQLPGQPLADSPVRAWLLSPLAPPLADRLPIGPGEALPPELHRLLQELLLRSDEPVDLYPGYERQLLTEAEPMPGQQGALFAQLMTWRRDGPAGTLTPTLVERLRSHQRQHRLPDHGELDVPTAVQLALAADGISLDPGAP